MPSDITADVDLYCTHSDLADELGGSRKLARLVPPDATDATELVRAQALRDVLKALARRTPPITEAMISDPTELKDAVALGALMRLYRAAITAEGDVHDVLYRDFRRRFEAEVQGLTVTISGSVRATNAVTVFRR